MKNLIFILITLLFLQTTTANARTSVSGLLDIVFKNAEERDLTNRTFRSFSTFHTSRTRLFFDSKINDKTSVFAQVLIDNYDFQLFAAYVKFTNLKGKSLNIKLGLIPNTVGSFSPRTYSNKNPLIGVPLLYNVRTSFSPMSGDVIRNEDDFLDSFDGRATKGFPVLYDACWNSGVDFYGYYKNWDYSFALIAGSMTKPLQQQEKNLPQATTHLTYHFSPGFSIGGSGYYGTYLFEGLFRDTLPIGKKENDYLSGGAGYDLYYSKKHFEVYSEAIYSFWEYPYLTKKLTAVTGYIEFKYKFYPAWYSAFRLGMYEPGTLSRSTGERVKWDYPVTRYEFGLGFKPDRMILIKLVAQINKFEQKSEFDTEHYAIQTSIMF